MTFRMLLSLFCAPDTTEAERDVLARMDRRARERARQRERRHGSRTVNRWGDRVEVIVREAPKSEALDAYLKLIGHPTEAAK